MATPDGVLNRSASSLCRRGRGVRRSGKARERTPVSLCSVVPTNRIPMIFN